MRCAVSKTCSSPESNVSHHELSGLALDSQEQNKVDDASIEGKEPPAALSITVSHCSVCPFDLMYLLGDFWDAVG